MIDDKRFQLSVMRYAVVGTKACNHLGSIYDNRDPRTTR